MRFYNYQDFAGNRNKVIFGTVIEIDRLRRRMFHKAKDGYFRITDPWDILAAHSHGRDDDDIYGIRLCPDMWHPGHVAIQNEDDENYFKEVL